MIQVINYDTLGSKYSMVLGYYGGIRKVHSLCARLASFLPANHLVVSLVAAVGLGAIKVGVDTRVDLVQHVAVVRASSCVAVSTANSVTVGTMSTVSASEAGTSGASVGARAILTSANAAST
jgi:hypothetical protein